MVELEKLIAFAVKEQEGHACCSQMQQGGNLHFFNDDLHQEQIQTELETLVTKLLNSLSCTGRMRESINDLPLL